MQFTINFSLSVIMKALTLLCILSICMVYGDDYELRYYQKAKLIKADIKTTSEANSDLHCSIECSKDVLCEGFDFDGSTCSILKNVAFEKYSEDKDFWVQLGKTILDKKP